jgi:hypothetical protein
MKKSIFEFGDKFGVESPFGDWVGENEQRNTENRLKESARLDFLGGEKTSAIQNSSSEQEEQKTTEYYTANGVFLGRIGTSKTPSAVKIVNDEIIEIKGGVQKVKKNLREIDNGIKAKHEPSTRHKSWYDRNSIDAHRENELYDFLKNWGDINILKSKEQEWGCAMFYKTFTDASGNEFIVFVVGDTITSRLLDELSPWNSGIYINGQKVTINSGYGWKSYAFVHTHPYGSNDRKEFSAGDYKNFLDYNMKGYMFAYGSRHLYKFYPKVYNDNTPFRWEPFYYFDVDMSTFDKIALLRSTLTTFNVLNEYNY